jgi:hypothetical protein
MEKQKATSTVSSTLFSGHSQKLSVAVENEKDKRDKLFNPIGFLNEICQKSKTTLPRYVTKNQDGPDHSPTFEIECIFKDMSFNGTGLTIKEAKENSALKAIEDLNLKDTLKENKPSFRIVEIGPYVSHSAKENDLGCVWDEECSDIKITFRRKDGAFQQFKTFVFTKISSEVE